MPSLNQIAYNILNLLTGGRSTNSEILSVNQIKFQVKYYRALLIRRDAERGLTHLEPFEQDLGYVDMEVIDGAEREGTYSGLIIKRSVKKLPQPVRLKTKEALTYVSPYNRPSENIPFLEPVRAPWGQYGKYTSNSSYCYIKDSFLYLVNDMLYSRLSVRGVFEDPEKVFEFVTESGLELYDEDSEFPISSDMLQQVTQSIVNTEGRILLSTIDPNEPDMDSQ